MCERLYVCVRESNRERGTGREKKIVYMRRWFRGQFWRSRAVHVCCESERERERLYVSTLLVLVLVLATCVCA